MTCTRFLYTLLFYALLPIILLRLLWRSRKASGYRRRWAERFGFFNFKSNKPAIWVHAVSVGETIAAVPLIKSLQREYPDHQIVVTTTTPTGSDRVTSLFGNEVFHVFAPYDTPGSVKRFLRRVKPEKAIIMETELWPNTIYYCHQFGVSVIVANARLSARSARGYQRFAGLTREMLRFVTAIAAQNPVDGQRFIDVGLDKNKLQITGSIKFDLTISDALRNSAQTLKNSWSFDGVRCVLIAASIHEGEDAIIIDAFIELLKRHSRLLLILVPRHPERFQAVVQLCEKRNLKVQQRSTGEPLLEHMQVLVGDTMGELMLLLGAADIAFIGGSLIPRGGHNMLEPAAWQLPILSGPHTFNFAEISQLLQRANALQWVNNASEVAEKCGELIAQPNRRQQMGQAAGLVVEQNRGALLKLLNVIRSC